MSPENFSASKEDAPPQNPYTVLAVTKILRPASELGCSLLTSSILGHSGLFGASGTVVQELSRKGTNRAGRASQHTLPAPLANRHFTSSPQGCVKVADVVMG